MADGNGSGNEETLKQAPPEAFGRGDLPKRPDPPEAFGRGEKRKESKEEPDEEDKKEDKDSDKSEGDDKQGEEKKDKIPFYKRPILMIVLISVVVILTATGIGWWLHTRDFETTDDAFIDGHIIHVAPRVAGRVAKLNVVDNQWVGADTVVIEIDPADFIVRRNQALAAKQQAEAKEEQAEADLLVAQATAEQAKADVLVAQANADNAAQDLKRFEKLPDGARSQQQLDNAIANQKSTAANLVAMQKKAGAQEAQSTAAKTAIDAAKAEVKSAQAQVEQRDLELSYTKVSAGQEGWVTRRSVEAGNYVEVGQELLAIVPKNVWVTANYKETQLVLMRPGQPAWVTVDSFPDHELRAHVDSIQAGSGTVFSLLPAENATGNYVKVVQRVPVKLVFDETPVNILAPGMSVEPKVRIRN